MAERTPGQIGEAAAKDSLRHLPIQYRNSVVEATVGSAAGKAAREAARVTTEAAHEKAIATAESVNHAHSLEGLASALGIELQHGFADDKISNGYLRTPIPQDVRDAFGYGDLPAALINRVTRYLRVTPDHSDPMDAKRLAGRVMSIVYMEPNTPDDELLQLIAQSNAEDPIITAHRPVELGTVASLQAVVAVTSHVTREYAAAESARQVATTQELAAVTGGAEALNG